MIEAAVTDVIGPAVAADNPHALLDQDIGHAEQIVDLRLHGGQFCIVTFEHRAKAHFQVFNTHALVADVGFGDLISEEDAVCQFGTDQFAHVAHEIGRCIKALVERNAHAHAEFGIIFKQELDQAGPRPSSFCAHGVVGKLPP